MKIVIAPDSFKGNLSSVEVAGFIAAGIKKADQSIQVIQIPIADGGEGSTEAMVAADGGQIFPVDVTGPLGKPVKAFWGLLSDQETAVIEMAAAAGLHLVAEASRNPMETTTYGVGQLIQAGLDHGVRRIIICIGGSSTNDGGCGMVQALGGVFYDKDGHKLGRGGKILAHIDRIDLTNLDSRLTDVEFTAACDVKNPLFGPNGAAYVYAPQKGADLEMVGQLDQGLEIYAQAVRQSLGIDVAEIPGSGAAGGLGAALVAFLNAQLKPGIDVVMDATKFVVKVKTADLLITGEGRTDGQTAFGKVPVGLAQAAAEFGVPVLCLSGGLAEGFEAIYDHGVTAALSNVTDAMPLNDAIENSGDMLTQSAYAITRLLVAVKNHHA